MPRRRREDFTWRSVYFPSSWLAPIGDLANKEDRSFSSMLRQLIRDGLAYRGIDAPELPPEYSDDH